MSLTKKTLLMRGIAFGIDTLISTTMAVLINCIIFKTISLQNITPTIIIGFTLLILRDIFGKSIGKYILGLNIIDITTNKKTNVFKRLLKNITTPITIIEIPICLLRADNKRLGDLLAKTSIKVNENNKIFTLLNQINSNK